MVDSRMRGRSSKNMVCKSFINADDDDDDDDDDDADADDSDYDDYDDDNNDGGLSMLFKTMAKNHDLSCQSMVNTYHCFVRFFSIKWPYIQTQPYDARVEG